MEAVLFDFHVFTTAVGERIMFTTAVGERIMLGSHCLMGWTYAWCIRNPYA